MVHDPLDEYGYDRARLAQWRAEPRHAQPGSRIATARACGGETAAGWQRWEYPWRPAGPGSHPLRARASDITGAIQPLQAAYNTQRYLFDGVVAHPVGVV